MLGGTKAHALLKCLLAGTEKRLTAGDALPEQLLSKGCLLLRGARTLTVEQLAEGLLLLGLLHHLSKSLLADRGLSLRGSRALTEQLLGHLRYVLTNGLILAKCLLCKGCLLGGLSRPLPEEVLRNCSLLLRSRCTLAEESLSHCLLLLCRCKALTKSLLGKRRLLGGLCSTLSKQVLSNLSLLLSGLRALAEQSLSSRFTRCDVSHALTELLLTQGGKPLRNSLILAKCLRAQRRLLRCRCRTATEQRFCNSLLLRRGGCALSKQLLCEGLLGLTGG